MDDGGLGRAMIEQADAPREGEVPAHVSSHPRHDGRPNGGVSLGGLPHGNSCRLSPPLWGALREGQLNGEPRCGTGCGSRRRLEDLPGSQIGQTVTPLAKEKRKIRVGTYEGGAMMKIS